MSQEPDGYVAKASTKHRQLYAGYALIRVSALVRRKLPTLAALAEFHDWKNDVFNRAPLARSREHVWKYLTRLVHSDGPPWRVLEFGVAWGYTTNWWLSRFGPADISSWSGFDRFAGLPRAWRSMPEGTFSADGKPPPLHDPRITWYIGDIDQTLKQFDFESSVDQRTLFYFDFDLYEPTYFAWKMVLPYIKPGDLLYFDEAAYPDERRVITENVLPNGKYQLICSSPEQILLRVESIKLEP
jgi:hypothetical protein